MSTPPTPPDQPTQPGETPIPEATAPSGQPAAADTARHPLDRSGTARTPSTAADPLAETARLSLDKTPVPPAPKPTAAAAADPVAETTRLSPEEAPPTPAEDLAETARLSLDKAPPTPADDPAETTRLSLDEPTAPAGEQPAAPAPPDKAPPTPTEDLAETARLSLDEAAAPAGEQTADPASPDGRPAVEPAATVTAEGLAGAARVSFDKAAEPAAPVVGSVPAPQAGPPAPQAHDPWATPAPGAFPPPAAGAPGAFAPPGAGAFAAPAGPAYGVPGGSWGAPGPGGYPGYPGYPGVAGYYPAPPPRTNGLAVAALVLGILSVLIGPIPFLFWIGTCLALTGIGLGGGALARARKGAGRKAMSVAGVVLGVVGLGASVGGWFLTSAVLDKARERIAHERVNDPQWGEDPEDWQDEPFPGPTPTVPRFSIPPTAPKAPKGPGISTPVPFGRTVSYPDGIKVTLAPPRKYVSKADWMDVGNAVEVSFTITNDGDKPHKVIYAMPAVKDDKGGSAKLVFDGDTPKRIEGVIQPGQSATGVAAFEVPEGTKSISAELSPGILMDPAKFSGPVE
ncbi:DUF4352 domain-containing protein [Streptomyces sp. NPDC096136]|uniref:DUF4352 domain-containing protein n=1 Tax=Streptomyces sp. NPDC096136 TaxID=3366076 RepID=UPI0037F68532